MKKTGIIILLLIAGLAGLPYQSKAQTIADDVQQLALDIQKLAGLKSVLNQMYQGYEVVSKGYNAVKDISEGNYSLHEAFLDGLLIVSPTVRKYVRVQDIINDQAELISEYQSASGIFRQDKQITPDEIGYMMDVYNNLVTQSLSNLSMLTSVITSNQLRMSDDGFTPRAMMSLLISGNLMTMPKASQWPGRRRSMISKPFKNYTESNNKVNQNI